MAGAQAYGDDETRRVVGVTLRQQAREFDKAVEQVRRESIAKQEDLQRKCDARVAEAEQEHEAKLQELMHQVRMQMDDRQQLQEQEFYAKVGTVLFPPSFVVLISIGQLCQQPSVRVGNSNARTASPVHLFFVSHAL